MKSWQNEKMVEKYYNIIYYCAYKLLFYFLYRLINPYYWLGLKKWNNNYINRCILINKQLESDTSDKGIDTWISVLAIAPVYRISLWIIAVICIIGIQFSRIKTLLITAFISDSIFFPLLIVIGLFVYYINDYFYSRTASIECISSNLIKKKNMYNIMVYMYFL